MSLMNNRLYPFRRIVSLEDGSVYVKSILSREVLLLFAKASISVPMSKVLRVLLSIQPE